MRSVPRLLLASLFVLLCGCGGSSPAAPSASPAPPAPAPQPTPGPSPTEPAPAPAPPAAVTRLEIDGQAAALGGSEFQISWSGEAPTYSIRIRSENGTDAASATATSSSFPWKAPAAGVFVATVVASNAVGESAGTELRLVSVDLRDVIDALVFSSGPLSELVQYPPDSVSFVGWPDGTQLRLLFAPAVGTRGRDLVRAFTNQYAAITNGAVTAVSESVADDMKSWGVAQVPTGAVAVRVMTLAEMQTAGICTASNTYGGCNSGAASSRRALTTLHDANASYAAHEIGHAYGMFHVNLPAGTRIRRGLMAGNRDAGIGSTPAELSQTEIRAIEAMQSAGVRVGTTRGQMKQAGLINR